MADTVKRSVFWAFLSGASDRVLGFAVFVMLARLLTPAEFGMVALAAAFVDGCAVLVRSGIAEAIIQRGHLSSRTLNAAFFSNLAISLLLTGVLAAGAGLLAHTFDLPEFEPLMWGLAPMLILVALGTVHEAQLVRRFGFKAMAQRTLVATLLGGVAALAAALAGLGPWSLVIQRLVNSGITSLFVWFAVPWLPRLRFRWRDVRGLWRFGGSIVASNLAFAWTLRIPEILIGYVAGPMIVGQFRLALRGVDLLQQLTMLPFMRVSFATFSRMAQDRMALNAMLLRMTASIGLLSFPVFLGAAILAPEGIALVFGPQWADSAGFFQLLCLVPLLMSLGCFYGPALAATGRPGMGTRLALMHLALTLAVTLAVMPLGALAIAQGLVARTLISTVIVLVVGRTLMAVPLREVGRVVVGPLLAATIMALATWLLVDALRGQMAPELLLATGAGFGAAVYTTVMLLLPVPQRALVRGLAMRCLPFRRSVQH